MGKKTRRIVGIAASIAVPFAAPVVAGALGVSSFIGKVAVGAAMGAGASKLGGGRLGKGAILGGLATGVNVGLQNMQAARAAEAANAAGQTAGLSSAPAAAPGALGEQAMNLSAQGGSNFIPSGINPALTPGAPGAAAATAPTMGGTFGGYSAGSISAANAGAAAAQAATANSFMQTLRNIGGGLFSGIQDPRAAAQLVTMLGGALIGGKDPGDQLSRDQMRALEQLRQQDERSYNFLMSAAQNLMAQANSIDPEHEGRMQAGLMQQRTGRSALESSRSAALNPNNAGLDYGIRARQNEVLGQMAAESAYQGGFMNAQNRRANLTTQAAGLAPRGANTGAFAMGNALLPSMQNNDQWDAMGNVIDKAGDAFGWWNQPPNQQPRRGTPP